MNWKYLSDEILRIIQTLKSSPDTVAHAERRGITVDSLLAASIAGMCRECVLDALGTVHRLDPAILLDADKVPAQAYELGKWDMAEMVRIMFENGPRPN